ncbi:hypothetical protein C9374_014126 [Naegleria lovaniensis]|uniref:Uncharacterized protein n=1 Tax=Naegleria lovaniensis TaxID=51637 RepID=A0AA88GW79_NAELO|nr:uncharacterized protein C9374_014126 [Naegleria lovaniensis]KAG2389566.1 hypothetical protein C9374_014126 [Naegleria lovaniensis]
MFPPMATHHQECGNTNALCTNMNNSPFHPPQQQQQQIHSFSSVSSFPQQPLPSTPSHHPPMNINHHDHHQQQQQQHLTQSSVFDSFSPFSNFHMSSSPNNSSQGSFIGERYHGQGLQGNYEYGNQFSHTPFQWHSSPSNDGLHHYPTTNSNSSSGLNSTTKLENLEFSAKTKGSSSSFHLNTIQQQHDSLSTSKRRSSNFHSIFTPSPPQFQSNDLQPCKSLRTTHTPVPIGTSPHYSTHACTPTGHSPFQLSSSPFTRENFNNTHHHHQTQLPSPPMHPSSIQSTQQAAIMTLNNTNNSNNSNNNNNSNNSILPTFSSSRNRSTTTSLVAARRSLPNNFPSTSKEQHGNHHIMTPSSFLLNSCHYTTTTTADKSPLKKSNSVAIGSENSHFHMLDSDDEREQAPPSAPKKKKPTKKIGTRRASSCSSVYKNLFEEERAFELPIHPHGEEEEDDTVEDGDIRGGPMENTHENVQDVSYSASSSSNHSHYSIGSMFLETPSPCTPRDQSTYSSNSGHGMHSLSHSKNQLFGQNSCNKSFVLPSTIRPFNGNAIPFATPIHQASHHNRLLASTPASSTTSSAPILECELTGSDDEFMSSLMKPPPPRLSLNMKSHHSQQQQQQNIFNDFTLGCDDEELEQNEDDILNPPTLVASENQAVIGGSALFTSSPRRSKYDSPIDQEDETMNEVVNLFGSPVSLESKKRKALRSPSFHRYKSRDDMDNDDNDSPPKFEEFERFEPFLVNPKAKLKTK